MLQQYSTGFIAYRILLVLSSFTVSHLTPYFLYSSTLKKSACWAAEHTLHILSKLSAPSSSSSGVSLGKIHKMECSAYRLVILIHSFYCFDYT